MTRFYTGVLKDKRKRKKEVCRTPHQTTLVGHKSSEVTNTHIWFKIKNGHSS